MSGSHRATAARDAAAWAMARFGGSLVPDGRLKKGSWVWPPRSFSLPA